MTKYSHPLREGQASQLHLQLQASLVHLLAPTRGKQSIITAKQQEKRGEDARIEAHLLMCWFHTMQCGRIPWREANLAMNPYPNPKFQCFGSFPHAHKLFLVGGKKKCSKWPKQRALPPGTILSTPWQTEQLKQTQSSARNNHVMWLGANNCIMQVMHKLYLTCFIH